MTKQCNKCKELKDILEFNKNKRRKDGFQAWCRPCSSKNNNDWYKENSKTHKKKILEQNRKYKEQNRINAREFILNSKCVDCGFKSHPECLSFYIDGERVTIDNKSPNVAKRVMEDSVIRCLNCQRILTSTTRKW